MIMNLLVVCTLALFSVYYMHKMVHIGGPRTVCVCVRAYACVCACVCGCVCEGCVGRVHVWHSLEVVVN